MPTGSPGPVASVSTVLPETLQRPLPTMYVMPAGSASVSCISAAGAVPELVYDSVTAIGPTFGEGPEAGNTDLFTEITEDATVVVSVFVAVVGVVSATV